MNSSRVLCLVLLLVMSSPWPAPAKFRFEQKRIRPWRAVHLLGYNSDSDLDALGDNLGNLVNMGINVLILEVDYNFAFKSHPKLRKGSDPITREGARRFAAACRNLGIRLIPELCA